MFLTLGAGQYGENHALFQAESPCRAGPPLTEFRYSARLQHLGRGATLVHDHTLVAPQLGERQRPPGAISFQPGVNVSGLYLTCEKGGYIYIYIYIYYLYIYTHTWFCFGKCDFCLRVNPSPLSKSNYIHFLKSTKHGVHHLFGLRKTHGHPFGAVCHPRNHEYIPRSVASDVRN